MQLSMANAATSSTQVEPLSTSCDLWSGCQGSVRGRSLSLTVRLVSSCLQARKVFSWWLCQRRTRRPTVALKIVTHVSQILFRFLFFLTPWRTWRTNKHQFEVFLCSVLFLNSYKCCFCEPFSWSLTQCPGSTLGMFSFFPPLFTFSKSTSPDATLFIYFNIKKHKFSIFLNS